MLCADCGELPNRQAIEQMKVSVGSVGQFHAYDLARQLEQRECLARLYTGFPKWKVSGLPLSKVSTFPWLMVPNTALTRLGMPSRFLNRVTIGTFDRWMSSHIKSCDIFHCMSVCGLYTHRVARERYGALTVCDRGSSHILYQDEILAEEYVRWGLAYTRIDQRLVERELREYQECDQIVVPSSFAYRSFLEKGIASEKIAQVPYGVDLSLFKPVAKEDRVFRVIYVGALSLQKGVPYILDALATLRLKNFELWLIGAVSSETQPFLDKHAEGFRYLGVLPRAELYRYYSQGSVFVIASVQEGLALVQAQAMACGLPVIATTNTGAEDLFTDGVEGFIVPIRNPEAIREKVLYLYEHPQERDEMARAALKRVQRIGGWSTYGEQMLLVYQNALLRRTRNTLSSSG
jgi:glycosyltransferase involved in cell wall biosynthesis